MQKHVLLIIASVLLILMTLSCAYAQEPSSNTVQNNSSVELPGQNSSSYSSSEMNENTISGTVNDCISKKPFPGVNISITDNGQLMATTTTKGDGSYLITFLSNHTNFNVTASHAGHYSVTKEVSLSPLNGSQQSGTVNFELGNTIYVNGNTGNDGWDGTSPTYNGGTTGPKKTIKAGLSASKNGGILSIAAGTYKGSDNRHLNINNMALTIIGNGTTGAGNTTIDPEQNDLIFFIGGGSSSNVIIQNLIFTGGEAHGTVDGDDGDDGGAIYNEGKLTINNCLFINNHARNGDNANAGTGHAGHGGDGGAIYNIGTLTITNSYFENNHAGSGGNASDIHDGDYGGSGGAIFNYGTTSITNCSFKDNYAGNGGNANAAAKAAPGGHGGAIFNKATISITNCTFDGNYAGKGGDASGLTDGKDGGNGGAIYNNGTISTLQNSNFTSNYAGNGGGTQAGAAYVGGNGGNGGAIYNEQHYHITIINCTFDGNHAGDGAEGTDLKNARDGGNGGAIYNYGIMSISGGLIKNSLTGVGGNAHGAFGAGDGGNGGAIYNGGNLTISNNCNIYDNKCGDGKDAATAGSSPGLGGNGGGIFNTGNLTISNSGIEFNYAGNSGASDGYKNGAPGGSGGGIFNTGNLTLQSGTLIHDNYAGQGGKGPSGGGNIYGGEGGYGGAIYNGGYLTITGNSTNMVQIYNNNAGTGGTATAFEVTGGNGGKGGGIYNKNYCIATYANIYNNTGGKGNTYTGDGDHGDITGGNGGDGGAFYNEGTLNLIESIITNNQAGPGHDGNRGGDGGDGGNGGAVGNTGTLNITNCQISNNKAGTAGKGGDYYYYNKWESTYEGGEGGTGGSGGAIYNTGKLTITGSSIIQNTAGNGGNGGVGGAVGIKSSDVDEIRIEDPGNGGKGGSGGGIFSSGSLINITNSIINNNIAGNGGDGGSYHDDIALDLWYNVRPAIAGNGGSGGGIYSNGTSNYLQNTTINNNTAGNGGNGSPVSRYPGETGGAGGNGGGLVIYNQTTIANCQISNNKAGNGGNGAKTNVGSGDNPSTEPGDGGAGGSGGGIYVYYDNSKSSYTANVNITHSTLDNNTAGNGGTGGVDDKYGSHSSNGGNGGNGGAVAIVSSKIASPPNYSLHLYLEESTITNNKAGAGGQPYLSGTKGIDGFGGALYSNDNHYFTVDFNRIVNNTPQAVYLNLSSSNYYTNLYNNWWGSNAGPAGQIAGNHIDSSYYSPWLILTITATPTSLYSNQTSSIVANLTQNSNGDNTLLDWKMHVPDAILVLFGADNGTITPSNNITHNGSASSTFTPIKGSRISTVSATVDNQTVTIDLNVTGLVDIRVLQYPMYYNTDTKRFEDTYLCANTPVFVIQINNYKYYDNATGVVMEYLLGDGYKYITCTTPGTGSISYNATTRTITWNIGSLTNGSVDFLKVYVQIMKTGNKTSSLTNMARLKQVDQKDTNTTNNQANYALISPLSADIQVNQTLLNYTTNGTKFVNYTISVANNGPNDATGLKITDKLPSGVEWVSDTSKGAYNITTGIWTIGTFHFGEAVKTLTITGKITGTSTVMKNSAFRSALNEYDWNSANNGQTTILVTSGSYSPCADISIYNYPWYYNTAAEKSKEIYMRGNTPIFVIQANNGNSYDDATGVVIEYIIGEGYEFIAFDVQDVGTATYNATSRTITWNIGFLPKGGTAFLKVITEIITTGNKTAALTSTARLKQLDQVDMNSKNNQSSFSIVSVSAKDLSSVQILKISSSSVNSNNSARPDNQNNRSTVPMQNTGVPLQLMVLAMLMVLGGLFGVKRE